MIEIDDVVVVVGIAAITLICGAAWGPWGLCVLPAGLALACVLGD